MIHFTVREEQQEQNMCQQHIQTTHSSEADCTPQEKPAHAAEQTEKDSDQEKIKTFTLDLSGDP